MTNILRLIKANLFFVLVIFAYGILSLLSLDKGLQGIQNSGYYLKEMLMIMPVIFVLTALIDTWVSKDAIIKFLGKEAKAKGVFFSFVLGSISAGPIYAAFPLCVMLHKKGASIKSIVIILSSWAVVKIPMLLNEAKFLGLKFMLVRWGLTIIAVIVFAEITSKVVKDEDIPEKIIEVKKGVFINGSACMGCTLCTKKYPELFIMDGKKAIVVEDTEIDITLLTSVIKQCPVTAIAYSSKE